MEDKNSKIIALLIAILIISILNIGYTLYHISNYNAQKEAGNARWKQVEERIVRIEDKIYKMEEK